MPDTPSPANAAPIPKHAFDPADFVSVWESRGNTVYWTRGASGKLYIGFHLEFGIDPPASELNRLVSMTNSCPDWRERIADYLVSIGRAANAAPIPARQRLVALARELIARVRENGHDVVLDPGFSFRLGVTDAENPLVQGKGLIPFALGVDLTPYEALLGPERDEIFAEALAGV